MHHSQKNSDLFKSKIHIAIGIISFQIIFHQLAYFQAMGNSPFTSYLIPKTQIAMPLDSNLSINIVPMRQNIIGAKLNFSEDSPLSFRFSEAFGWQEFS